MNQLSPQDWLTRFIFSKSHYSPESNRVKYGAFMPARNAERGVFELSVSKTTGAREYEIWKLGGEVAKKSQRTLRARGDVTVSKVEAKKLEVNLDNIPPRHGNIIGWPDEVSEQKLVAIELSADAVLHIK